MDNNKFLNSQGYTLIEIVIVLGIITILSGFGIAKYNAYNQQLILKNQAKKLADVFELTKKKAMSSELIVTPFVTPPTYCTNFIGYQIEIAPLFYKLEYGCNGVYSTIVQTYDFPTNISATQGTGIFTFSPLGTGTNLTINSIRLKNSKIDDINHQCIDISISPIGIVNINETLISC